MTLRRPYEKAVAAWPWITQSRFLGDSLRPGPIDFTYLVVLTDGFWSAVATSRAQGFPFLR